MHGEHRPEASNAECRGQRWQLLYIIYLLVLLHQKYIYTAISTVKDSKQALL